MEAVMFKPRNIDDIKRGTVSLMSHHANSAYRKKKKNTQLPFSFHPSYFHFCLSLPIKLQLSSAALPLPASLPSFIHSYIFISSAHHLSV